MCSIAIITFFEKLPYLKKNSDTGFSNFAIEYLRENEKVRETVFACSFHMGPRSNLLSQKMVKNLVTLSL